MECTNVVAANATAGSQNVGPSYELQNILNEVYIDNDGVQTASMEQSMEQSTMEPLGLYIDEYWIPQTSIQELRLLLCGWNFEILFQILCDEGIDIDTLKLMTSQHIKQLTKKYNLRLGTQIRFEHKLNEWKKAEKNTEIRMCSEASGNGRINVNEEFDPLTPKTKDSNVEINVEEILNASSQGKTILTLYKSSQSLNEGSRTVIVDTIIKYMLQKEIRMTVQIAKILAESIVNLFKTEYLGYYYSKQNGKKPQGKVYDKYYNATRLLKTSGLLPKRSYTAQCPVRPDKRVFNLDPPESEASESVEEIIKDNCTWVEIERHWAASKNFRLAEILKAESTAEILTKWKQYKNPKGFKLIDMDFKHLFPNAESFILKYNDFSTKIIPIFEEIKDPTNKTILIEMNNKTDITENGRCCGIFYLIHSLLTPTSKLVTGSSTHKTHTRFSIKDSQASFILVASSVAACEEEILRRQDEKKNIQPFVIITGTVLEPKDIVVYFDEIKYRQITVISAIDLCFKIFNLFNLQYPMSSSLVWAFIQSFFYKIETSYDKNNPKVNTLINKLNNQ